MWRMVKFRLKYRWYVIPLTLAINAFFAFPYSLRQPGELNSPGDYFRTACIVLLANMVVIIFAYLFEMKTKWDHFLVEKWIHFLIPLPVTLRQISDSRLIAALVFWFPAMLSLIALYFNYYGQEASKNLEALSFVLLFLLTGILLFVYSTIGRNIFFGFILIIMIQADIPNQPFFDPVQSASEIVLASPLSPILALCAAILIYVAGTGLWMRRKSFLGK